MGSISARTLITTILITMMLGSALDCTDSDGGKNYYTQGHLIGEMAQPGGSTYHLDSFDACTDATRVSEYFCYVEGGVEYGLWETYNCANEGKFCENGVCVDPEPLPPCTDSDGGKDYYTQGHLVGEMEQPGGSTYHLDGFDTCTDATRVSEYFCYIEGGVEYGIWETYNCANEGKFCENGVCVDPEPLPPCTDSDGGKDYYTQGHLIGEMAQPGGSTYHLDSFDACTDATRVSEYFCYLEGGIEYGIWETYNCANEGKICEEGKCVADPEAQDAELECTDSDGGKDYYVKGHLVGEMSQPGGSTYHLDGFDACTDATRVSEYFCYVEGGVEYGLWETYNCANEGKFCENGVCVDPEPLPPCTDSDGGKDYYTKGHLVGEMEQPGGSTYHLDGFDACTDATRVSEYFCYVEGGIEYGIWETYNCANEGKLCEEGVCVDPEPLPPCTDSDGGKDYYVKGHLVGEMEQPGGSTYHLDGFDACTDATRVSEYFCYVEGGVEYGIWETYNCADEGKVCEDGSCIPSVEDTPPCTDSDGGKDYYTKGNLIGEMEQPGGSTYHLDSSDACTDPTRLSEYFCYEEDGIQYGIWETYDCADEEKLCENGVCIEPDQEDEVQLCQDSDGGKDYYTKGHLVGEMAQPGGSTYHLDSFDACTDATRVSEYFCYLEGGIDYGIWETYNCADEGKSCEDGACVVPAPAEGTPPCADSDGGKDYYTKGHLVGEMEQPGGSTYHLDSSDACTDATRVSEYFCYVEGGIEYGIWETYDCANEGKACEDGVCVVPAPAEGTPPCTDSDGGKDYYTQGHLVGEMAQPGGSTYHLDSSDACTDATRVSEYFCYVEGGVEYGIWETHDCADEGKLCNDGVCVTDPAAQGGELECTDSDGGKDYYEKGNLVGEMAQPGGSTYHLDSSDACTDATRVSEYFCYVEGGVEYGIWETYDCANEGKACEDGACVAPAPAEGTPPCTDSDGGKDYYVKGQLVGEMEQPGGSTYHLDSSDACTDATRVSEYFCYVEGGVEYGIWETYDCANEGKACEDGACVAPAPAEGTPPCTDSDGGKDYYVKGQLVGEMEQPGGSTYHLDSSDACTDGTRVSEYFCYVEGGVDYGLWETYNCADEGKVCQDGQCVLSSDAGEAMGATEKEASTKPTSLDALILATIINYPDAIVSGAAAEKLGIPVLLTPPDALPDDVAAFITEEMPSKVILLGGTAVISQAIENKLKADGLDTVRLWGITRFGTAAELALYAWEAGTDGAIVVYDRIEGAEGDEHTQLVMAKSLAAARTQPILLTTNEELPAATKEALEELGVQKVTLVGTQFSEDVFTALKELDIELEVVTGETVEDVNDKLQEEVVDELTKNLPEGKLERLVVVAAGTDYKASISLPASAEVTASMMVLDVEQIPRVIEFIGEHGITEVTVVGIPELTSAVVAKLLMVEGIQVSALSTQAIEKGLVDRLKERRESWRNHREKRLVDRKVELIRKGDKLRERTERAVEKAQRVIDEIDAALTELKGQELPDELRVVIDMFEEELDRARQFVEEAGEITKGTTGRGRDFAEALRLLKKAEGVAREAKYKGMKMIAEFERRQMESLRRQKESEAERLRKERDAMAEELLGDMDIKENLRERILSKGDRLAEIRERVKEDRDRGPPGERRFGPSLEGREIGPRFDKDRFRKKDLSKRSFGKDLSLRGADPCKRCIKKCGDEEQGPECAFICADTCGKSPCELCNEYCPEEIDDPRMCPIICGEVCRMADEVADFRGFKPPRHEDGRESSGLTCCQPDRGAASPACIVDLGQPCPDRYRPLEDEWVDPFNDGNCIGDKGDRGPQCRELDLSDARFPEDGGRYRDDGRDGGRYRDDDRYDRPFMGDDRDEGRFRDDYGDEGRFRDDDRWLPPPDLPPKHGPGDVCRECVEECFAKGEDGAECGFICERPCGVDACEICEKGCRINGLPPAECHNTCQPACERPDEFGYDEGSQCDRCVDDCMGELGNLDECSGICEDACHRDPCSVCEGHCPRILGDASECHDTCGRVCDRAPPEPSGPDPITLCREQCKGQGEAEACMKFCIRRWDKGTLSGPSDDTVRSALMERKEAEFRGSNQDVHDTDLRENLDERYTSIESHFGNASVARGWRNTLIGLDLLPLGSYPQVTIENEERTYDYYGRLSATRTTTTKNYEGSEEEFTRETFIEYGSLGEVMEIRETTVTGGIDLDETTVTDIHYDDEGRVTGYTYTEVTDEGGTREITVTISYDDDGKVTSVQIEDTTDSEDVGETDITDISYDDDGRMKGYRQTVKRAGSTLEFICGDGTCSVPFESVHRCLVDCAICGDSICSFPFEDDGTCGADCDRWGDSRQG